MHLIEETRRAFEEYLAVACEGLLQQDSFTEESIKALMHSLQGKTEALRQRFREKDKIFPHHNGVIEGW